MRPLREAFDERLDEIDAYLQFLAAIEREIQAGKPRLGETGPTITARQQRILYSSVYLQLYNLVEATITKCLDAVCDAAATGGQWKAGDLCSELRREWVRYTARTHVTLTDENRLRHALELVEQLVQALPIARLKVEKSGGSWDDEQIETITRRIGLPLRISQPVYQGVKQKLRDDKGALALIAALRNDLAHGSLSFAECGQNVLVVDLRDLKDKAALYLGEVVDAFEAWITAYEFLIPHARPVRDVA